MLDRCWRRLHARRFRLSRFRVRQAARRGLATWAASPRGPAVRLDEIRDTLRAEPSPASAAVATATRNSRVEVLERKGFWMKIKSGSATGWVKMTGVATDAAAGQGAGSLSSLASGRSGSGNIVSASGTRGLSEAELRGRRRAEAVKQVKKLAVSSTDSAQFATDGHLQTRKLDYVKR
jgi:hypothetical protein